jgi:hypothetical protein
MTSKLNSLGALAASLNPVKIGSLLSLPSFDYFISIVVLATSSISDNNSYHKEDNLRGGTVIDGFPSGGLTNSIASTRFMRSLRTELVKGLDSLAFLRLSVIYSGIPNFPTRIYANESVMNVVITFLFLLSSLSLTCF